MNTVAATHTHAAPPAGSATPAPRPVRRLGGRKELFKAALLVLLPTAIFFVGREWYDETYYNAEDGLGYWLGLVGGVVMLLAYVYSMRKHIPGMRNMGALGPWLRIHIAFGILGPFLILPHTTFKFESLNGTIAFFSMAIVFLSGVVGRYLYSKVHFGLDGRKAELRELTQMYGLHDKERLSVLAAIEPLRARLIQYERIVMAQEYGLIPALRALVMTRLGGHTVHWGLSRKVREYLIPVAQQQGWDRSDLAIAERQTREMLRAYMMALMDVSKFKAYDQLFVLWRMVHVPLLFLLFISGVLHVLAVHMY